MARSQNGYPANEVSRTQVRNIPGTSRNVRLEAGDAGYLLLHFASWFDEFIESVDGGQLDDWGYAERPIRGGTSLSNHASGTALDLNAPRHPMGVRGTFTRAQTRAIREQLKVYDGCIRWGGDYSGRPDEMHFEINRPARDVARVAKRLRGAPVNRMDPRNYYLGARGNHVTWLGRRLVAHGFADAYAKGPGPRFTEADRRNVAAFQRAQGWTGADADGFPGPMTLRLLAGVPKPKYVPKPKPTPNADRGFEAARRGVRANKGNRRKLFARARDIFKRLSTRY